MLPVFVFILIAMIDVSLGFYAAIEVNDAAEAGAMYGSLNSVDSAGMVSAALVDAADFKGGVTAVASWGCECSDGSQRVSTCASPPSSCQTRYVTYVQVNTSWSYNPLLPYPGIPKSYNLQAVATMRGLQ